MTTNKSAYDAYIRFEELVEKIGRDIGARCSCTVYKDSYLPKSLGFHLYKSQGRPKYVFAQIRPRKVEKLCRIYSAKDWAIKAGVLNTIDGERTAGWYSRNDEVLWDVETVDDEHYKEVIKALGEICKLR